ncbi:helix-turn-helix domain-containing protein [Kiloniella laminariae]|uniref:helix-turn-helix domain-containing protein n=1 Tax=Kiloniella laminariae TaxID=454162 RepID=UPI00036218DB|nr:AraC family transcriptional regulator [Kiloniella laminariae]
MIDFPVVWLVSVLTVIAAVTLAQSDRIISRARVFLCLYLLCLGGIGFILGLRLSFDSKTAASIQPFIAVMSGPSAYLGFRALSVETDSHWYRVLFWTAVSVFIAVVLILLPIPISADFYILTINSLYLTMIAGLLRLGSDDFFHVSSWGYKQLRQAIYATLFLLGIMIAVDGLIAAASLFATKPFMLELLSGVSGIFAAFIFIVALIGLPLVFKTPENAKEKLEPTTAEDRVILEAIEVLLSEQKLYKDSSLTLVRVAKRLSEPARRVSIATNRATGENFSRYVNGYRIRHAKRALAETDLSITEVMFESGFISKSSFNTEFRRITGQTPTQYRASQAGG